MDTSECVNTIQLGFKVTHVYISKDLKYVITTNKLPHAKNMVYEMYDLSAGEQIKQI